MAFLSQITLSSSVSTAFTQWLWHTVQKVDVTVPGITALFSLDSSLTGFRNKEVWQKFPGVTLIALLKWYGSFIQLQT
jgi:hypothetical protein